VPRGAGLVWETSPVGPFDHWPSPGNGFEYHGRLERTEPIAFGYEYTDVGRDSLSPVTDDYSGGPANACTGAIKWIEVEAGLDSHDHLIDPELLFNAAMYEAVALRRATGLDDLSDLCEPAEVVSAG
jgi:hypothetical protein